VVEAEGVAAAAVTGCVGVERHRFVFRGRIGHAGTTPMEIRRDAGLAAAATALGVDEIARGEGGVGTVGQIAMEPGIPTAVPGTAAMLVDLRHAEPDRLAAMLDSVREAAAAGAEERGCEVTDEPVWRIDPTSFDPDLVALARRACDQVAGRDFALPSGALHDAAEIARVVPAAMVFSPSIDGISHAPDEDTAEEDLRVAIEVFGYLANSHLTATAS
jgi:N-carbamoyl-L-amino-acid hydrolase